MKDIKVSKDNAKQILAATKLESEDVENVLKALEAVAQNGSPWWVIALKTLAYLIGLLLAGYGTTAAAQACLPIL